MKNFDFKRCKNCNTKFRPIRDNVLYCSKQCSSKKRSRYNKGFNNKLYNNLSDDAKTDYLDEIRRDEMEDKNE